VFCLFTPFWGKISNWTITKNTIVANDIGIIKTVAPFNLNQFVKVIEMEIKNFIPLGEF